jgi:hypothetical protein
MRTTNLLEKGILSRDDSIFHHSAEDLDKIITEHEAASQIINEHRTLHFFLLILYTIVVFGINAHFLLVVADFKAEAPLCLALQSLQLHVPPGFQRSLHPGVDHCHQKVDAQAHEQPLLRAPAVLLRRNAALLDPHAGLRHLRQPSVQKTEDSVAVVHRVGPHHRHAGPPATLIHWLGRPRAGQSGAPGRLQQEEEDRGSHGCPCEHRIEL